MIAPWKEEASTFDAPVLADAKGLVLIYKGYESELRRENRSSAAEYLEVETWQSPSGTVIEVNLPRFPYEYFVIPEARRSQSLPKLLSLSDARKLALAILREAESRRLQEREREAEYWKALDGEE